jgi:hypothetical protein
MADALGSNNVLQDSTGDTPKVSDSLEVENRSIASVNQAFSVGETLISDAKKLIQNAARLTAKLNGERPYNQRALKNNLKDWKTNISTGFLSTECSKVLPRFYMPLKTAKYLTAASLPAGHPNGAEKTAHFRQVMTDAVRSWPKFNFYIRGKAREVGVFGYSFDAWFDEYEWRPTLLKMDKGFVPQGTEIMEEPQFFLAKWDYKPSEILQLLRQNVEAGRSEWKKDNVVKAINAAYPPPVDASYPESRSYEDLVRQATWGYAYTKGAKVVRTWHLFAKEATGTVSHYILLADSAGGTSTNGSGDPEQEQRLLYENLDQFGSMGDAVKPTVFDYGDGTIHGSWGAGQILYDLSVQVEKVRCDSIDNIRLTNKVKAQVPDAKNVNDVKLTINDQFVIISGAQFAGNTAGLTSDVAGYEALDQKLSQIAQQKIGAFVPPIPLQPSDIKAAQINAAMSKEKELQEALLENWLIQWAEVMQTITKRLCNPESPDPVAQRTMQELLVKLTIEEIAMLRDQFPVKSVIDFTEFRAQQRAAFASTVVNNPLFRQTEVARTMAEGVGDEAFVSSLIVPEGDQTDVLTAQRQQLMECAAMANGDPVPVIPNDNDWVHMQTLKPRLQKKLTGDAPNLQYAQLELQHYAAHWSQGVNKKTIPKESINEEKAWIAAAEKAIATFQEQAQIKQQTQEVMNEVDAKAQELVATGQV